MYLLLSIRQLWRSIQVLHVYLFLVSEIRKKNLLGVGNGWGEGGTGATSTSALGKVLV